MKQSRDERKYQIADYLIDKGIHISLPEVEELAVGVVGKPHFAQVLVRHGYAANVQDAFTKYLNTPEYRKKVKRRKRKRNVRQAIYPLRTSSSDSGNHSL
jgi:hypothetical protein